MIEYVNTIIDNSIKAHNRFAKDNTEQLIIFAQTIVNCLNNGGKILICGNGGSAAGDSQFKLRDLSFVHVSCVGGVADEVSAGGTLLWLDLLQ